jgi:hypothetical protein
MRAPPLRRHWRLQAIGGESRSTAAAWAHAPTYRRTASRGHRNAGFSGEAESGRRGANIRANKPVPECRTVSHGVVDVPWRAVWTSQDATRRDDPTRVATSIDLPGSQEAQARRTVREGSLIVRTAGRT